MKQLKKWLAQEKETLAVAGVTTIVGEYSGSGDEGFFNGVCVVGLNGFSPKCELTHEIEELTAGAGGAPCSCLPMASDRHHCSLIHEELGIIQGSSGVVRGDERL